MTIDLSLANDVFYADVPAPLAEASVAALVASTAEIESSHSPFLSMPARVAEILGGVARTLA